MDKNQKMLSAVSAVCVIMMTGTLGVSAVSMAQIRSMKESVTGLEGSVTGMKESVTGVEETVKAMAAEAEPKPTAEDDVEIMDGTYTIRSTMAISDAYISGDTSALDDRQKETLDMAKKVLDEIITDGMTDYEKEKAVYEWMTTKLGSDKGLLTVIPSSGEDSDNPYGVLKYRNAVCVGYATTFRMFMEMMGIECHVVHNTALYHSWDLVKLDGEYYHVDIYSDAGSGNYSHFNLTDEMEAQNETWDIDYFPHAQSLTYNLAYQNAIPCENVYDIAGALRTAMDEHRTTFCLTFNSEIDEEKAAIGNQIAYGLDYALMNNYNEGANALPSSLSQYQWVPNTEKGGYLMLVGFNWNDDSGNTASFDEETTGSMDSALQSAFSDILPDISSSAEYTEYTEDMSCD